MHRPNFSGQVTHGFGRGWWRDESSGDGIGTAQVSANQVNNIVADWQKWRNDRDRRQRSERHFGILAFEYLQYLAGRAYM